MVAEGAGDNANLIELEAHRQVLEGRHHRRLRVDGVGHARLVGAGVLGELRHERLEVLALGDACKRRVHERLHGGLVAGCGAGVLTAALGVDCALRLARNEDVLHEHTFGAGGASENFLRVQLASFHRVDVCHSLGVRAAALSGLRSGGGRGGCRLCTASLRSAGAFRVGRSLLGTGRKKNHQRQGNCTLHAKYLPSGG